MTASAKVRDVFLLSGGSLQLLNSIEAFHYFDALDNSALIAFDSLYPTFSQLEVKEWHPSNVHWIKHPGSTKSRTPLARLLHLYRFTKIVEKILEPYRECNRLFLGTYILYGGLFRHFARLLAPRKIIYVIDGSEIVNTSAARKKSLENGERDKFKTCVRNRILGWDTRHLPGLDFFSPIPPSLVAGDTYIENRYSHISSSCPPGKLGDKTLFVGQPTPSGGQNADEYWDRIRSIAIHFGAEMVEYVVHPREEYSRASSRCSSIGIKCRPYTIPLEVLFCREGPPKALISFSSTSLLTCKQLFGSQGLESFYLRFRRSQEFPKSELELTFEKFNVRELWCSPKTGQCP